MKIPKDDEYVMPFGKHKGAFLKDVPADYLCWFADQEWADKWPELLAYCKKNRQVLEEEQRAHLDGSAWSAWMRGE